MKHLLINIDRLLNSVGSETFVKYYYEFKDLHKDEIKTIFNSNEKWKYTAINQKVTNGKRIFKEKREIEALEHIILIKKTNNIPNGEIVKDKAKNILLNYSDNVINEINQESISNTEKRVLIKHRIQQSKFRSKLLIYWEGCSITNCKNSNLLIASHIKPFSESNENEKYDYENGLLLTPTYDKLFDNYLITFNIDGNILISKSIIEDDLIKLNITGNEKINKSKLTTNIKKYLNLHYEKFIEKEKNNS